MTIQIIIIQGIDTGISMIRYLMTFLYMLFTRSL